MNGAETHGISIYGYDAFKEKYSYFSIHDGETQALTGLGDRDSTSGAITFAVAMDMPMSAGTRCRSAPCCGASRAIATCSRSSRSTSTTASGR
jgi:hypothetical protein